MTVEEPEYFSMTAGNGLSPVTRPQKGPTKKATAAASNTAQKGGVTSFLQGITVGAVLLIPVGVWCWVRPASTEIPAIQEDAPAAKTAGKPGKRPAIANKRKAVKSTTASTILPASRIDAGQKALVVDPEPPPPIPVSTPSTASPLLAKPQVSEEFDEPQKPKKGIWRTLAAPFHGKSKTAEPRSEP